MLSRAERYEQESRYRDRQLVGREEGDIRRVGGAVPVPEVAATLRGQEKVRKHQQHFFVRTVGGGDVWAWWCA